MRSKIGLEIFVLIFLSSMMAGFNTNALSTLKGVAYSEHLKAGTELTWKVDELSGTDNITLFSDYKLHKGDVIKIKLLINVSDLELIDIVLWEYTEQKWGELYVNDVLITSDPSTMDASYDDLISGMFLSFILPTTLIYDDGNRSSFDVYYENLENLQYSNSSDIGSTSFSVSNSGNTFSMKYDANIQTSNSLFGDMKLTMNMEIAYNKEWGVLSLFTFSSSMELLEESSDIAFTLKSTTPGVAAPFNLSSVLIAIGFIGIVSILLKRKRGKK